MGEIPDYWGGPTAEEAAEQRRDVIAAAVQLRNIFDKGLGEPGLLYRWTLVELDRKWGGEVQFDLLGLFISQITANAPDDARDEHGVPVLDRIMPHQVTPEHVTRTLVAMLDHEQMEQMSAADLKAYATRAVNTGNIAQQLVGLRHPGAGEYRALTYSLALMQLSTDEIQFNDVLQYLVAASLEAPWTI
ncbi:hypothetical protein [Streptacidiphilus anmyonensis]|uniref:hypothetical protein n=1 Tax=Streptacidiphilus anmyonensis TaxID=405782 RepID=UPI0005A6B8F8|nr:hypothetical protein [Streptacidiphilus anmyonensis]